LLANGADVTARDNRKCTLLHLYEKKANQEALLQFLMTKYSEELDINAKSRSGSTALTQALSWRASENYIYALLKNGAQVTTKKVIGIRPLKVAKRNYGSPLVDVLKEVQKAQKKTKKKPLDVDLIILKCTNNHNLNNNNNNNNNNNLNNVMGGGNNHLRNFVGYISSSDSDFSS